MSQIRDDVPDFREEFYLHMVLLKQHLFSLLPSPPHFAEGAETDSP